MYTHKGCQVVEEDVKEKKKDGKLAQRRQNTSIAQGDALTGYEMMLPAAYGAKEQQG